MLGLLQEALEELPDLIGAQGPDWNSLYIDYHKPIVHRVWLQWRDDYRIWVGKILPCSPKEALYHPHPWPSAMIVLDGEYEMGIGTATYRLERPPVSTTAVLTAGSRYVMPCSLNWHYVAPKVPTYTVMLSGPPFKDLLTDGDMKALGFPELKDLGPLTIDQTANLQTAAYLFLQILRNKGKV